MPVRQRDLAGEDLAAAPEPKRCRHCDESRSPCGGGEAEGSGERASWRVTLDLDLVETLSAIYPEWFKPQTRDASSRTPRIPHSDDTIRSCEESEMGREGGGAGSSEAPCSPRISPPKVVVDDSPLQPAMGKHKESLKVKLMMRRPINQLVAQGIMPPLKTPPAYFEQCKQLERAKTGDLLKAKIQKRPDRQELERRHILEQESHVDPSLAEKQRMLKKARLADQLNDQLSHRPGPLELIKKNILHTEEDIETAVKSGILSFKATCEGSSGRPEHPSSYCGPPDEVSPSPSPPSTLSLSPASVASPPQHPAPGKDKNRKKSKQKQQQPKARFKFHEYKGPPNAHKASSPPGETPYKLLLQQQQLLLQLMLPASPAPSSASDCSDAYSAPPPPPPLPAVVHHIPLNTRYEDMKVSDLRVECKRLNLPVSGPKQQLLDRLRPYLADRHEEIPKSPMNVISPEPRADSEPPEDIVQSQRRQIEELERRLKASCEQLEAVRRSAAGAAASEQSRRVLQARIYVSQLRAQLDALQAPPPPRYVLAPSPATPDRLVRLFTVAAPAPTPDDSPNPAYILNGVNVVPITILPSAQYEPERPPSTPHLELSPVRDHQEDSQIIDDVLEILAKNGDLPESSPCETVSAHTVDSGYLTSSPTYSPNDVMSNGPIDNIQIHDTIAGDDLQRELNDIQNKILNQADLHTSNNNICPTDSNLSVELLSGNDFPTSFGSMDTQSDDHNSLFGNFLSGDNNLMNDNRMHTDMDIGDDIQDRMSMTPLTNGDILDHVQSGFADVNDLSLPFHNDDCSQQGTIEERPEFDLKEFGIDLSTNMDMDTDSFDYMDTELIPNIFGRGHIPQCDPLLGGVLSRQAPRPARKHYSWNKIDFEGT